MKARKLLSVFCSAALISTCAMSPLSSLTAYADQTLVDVPLQEIEKQNGNITEIISVGGYTELRPDTADIPEMPDVLKNRESKHHVFERREDHSINFRGELIMPGDTFEIPSDITREMIYTTDFLGRGDVEVNKENGKAEMYFGKFSPENYGIEVTGSVDIIDYDDYDSGDGVSLDGKHVSDRFFRTAKNNLNCPIIIGPSGGGGDGPYVFYDDHDQRKQHTDVYYTVLAPYYFITYRFISDVNDYGYAEFDKLFWPAGEFESLEFPEYYWLTDEPYTLKIPNCRMEGRAFNKWLSYDSTVYYKNNDPKQNIKGDYTELNVEWTYEVLTEVHDPYTLIHEDSDGNTYETQEDNVRSVYRLPEYFEDVNIRNAGSLTLSPALDGNHRTIEFDANGGTINGRDKWLIEVNEVKREDEAKYGENHDSRIPDDGDFGFDINDYVPVKPGDTFLGWCADKEALQTSFVTKDSTVGAYRYFWEDDELGTFTDKYTRQHLYAKWASGTDDEFEKKGWSLSDDGLLRIMNDDGAVNWTKASKADPSLAPKVKSIELGYKNEKVNNLPTHFLKGCTQITELVFDEPVSFGGFVFDGCPNLTDVTLNFPVQGTWFPANAYMGTNKDFTLHVPDEYYNEYKDALGEYAYLLQKPNGQRYPLTVNGEIVTDDNLEIKCGDGTAKYDPKTNTLTLTNAVLTNGLKPHFDIHYYENNDTPDNPDRTSSTGSYAVVSDLDDLTVVIEGNVDVNTYIDNTFGSTHEELPNFIYAKGDLEINGSGVLKATLNDASLQYKDNETMEFVEYVGPGKAKAFVNGNLTLNDVTTARLYADVLGDFNGRNATVYGGLLNVCGSIDADGLTVKDYTPPQADLKIAQELATVQTYGKGKMNFYKCSCEYTVICGINQCEEINFIDCTVTLVGQLKGDADTKLNINNSNLFIMGIDQAPTNIPAGNITVNDAEIVLGDWADKDNTVMIQAKNGAPEDIILGDVNGDKKVTAKDSMQIQRYTVNLTELSEERQKAADVDGNKKVTNADALNILRYTINVSVKYPIGKEIGSVENTDTDTGTQYDYKEFDYHGQKFQKMGDVFKYKQYSTKYKDGKFYYSSYDTINGETVFFRAVSELSDEFYAAYYDVVKSGGYAYEDVYEALKDSPITSIEDYTDKIPSQEFLNSLVNKRGYELNDMGFHVFSVNYTGRDTIIRYKNSVYQIQVYFNESFDYKTKLPNDGDFTMYTVRKAEFDSLFEVDRS